MREVIVWEGVYNTLWQQLDKERFESLRSQLFRQLENKYDRWRGQRHPDDETVFVMTLYQPHGADWHRFEFHVDDTMAEGFLFVVGVIPHVDKDAME